jgi:quinoprotein glucose dehydrogenase
MKILVLAILGVLAPQEDSSELKLAVRKLEPAPGLKVDLFAGEPQLANPVALWVDDRGRVFVSETHRYNTSALYVKQHSHWYFDDLACRTVEDREAVARKFMGADAAKLAVDSEIIRLLEDKAGTGRADTATVFADGFNSMSDGCASGVIVRGNDVWVTDVPNLWCIRDGQKRVLHTGFGVRFGNSGHDLHGPVFGPDGKLYFSMGDRGLSVGKAALPDMGAVLRCNPDGSDFEVFATGLRNPQGLTFDALGNLWTGDNNADMGDEARWVYVVEGGDSGWRTGFQYATDPWAQDEIKKGQPLVISKSSTWMTEEIWKGAPASVVPPVGFVARGPSGVSYYPGTGLPARYEGHFFLCDFPGGIHSFAVKPKGAGYELEDVHRFLWEAWPTDAKFGPDGRLYMSDWVHGFPMTGKGRVFRIYDPKEVASPRTLETKALLGGGLPADRLEALLCHGDLRVRQNAQFALVAKGARDVLARVAKDAPSTFGRLHAIWGLGQLKAVAPLGPLLDDADAEVRAQAAKVLGELRAGLHPLIARLDDPQPRVRFMAAIALGKLGKNEAFGPLVEMLRKNADADAFLRHAGVMGLAGIGDVPALAALEKDASRPVRLAALLALRRLERQEVELFLDDADPLVVVEAARAINDVPIPAARGKLAALLGPSLPPPALLRAINANFRGGTSADVFRLASFVAAKEAPADLRAEGIQALAAWGHPTGRDRLLGVWRPLPARDGHPATEALRGVLPALLRDAGVQATAIRAAVAIGLRDPMFEELTRDRSKAAALRGEALRALVALNDPGMGEAVRAAIADKDVAYQTEGVTLLPGLRSPLAAELLSALALGQGSVEIRQAAIAGLARVGAEAARVELMDRLEAGKVPAALAFDILEAARGTAALDLRKREYDSKRDPSDPLSAHRELLEGGDVREGKRIFYEHAGVACLRCHKIGKDGGEVGPSLSGLGSRMTRSKILESILYPNKEIAPGYGQEMIQTEDGNVIVGRLRSEDEREVVLFLPEGVEERIPKSRVKARKPGLSAMPEDVAKGLSRRDLRNLVSFLAQLRASEQPMPPLPAADAEGWISLFNGKDLAGWDGDPEVWRVENGYISGKAPKIARNTFLIYNRPFGDFVLEAKVWMIKAGSFPNSGIQYRSIVADPKQWIVHGYQADIGDTYWGTLYEEKGKRGQILKGREEVQRAVRDDDWNLYVITARGAKLSHTLNGVDCGEFEDRDEKARRLEGIIAFQYHAPGQFEVRFKDIRIKPLGR